MEYSLEPIDLSKEIILGRISEEEIFNFYGVPVTKGLFCSSLRNDKNPTVSLYRNKSNKLIYHDFGDGTHVDCFGYVQEKFGVSYYMALQIIANDFGIISRPCMKKNKPKIEYSGVIFEAVEQARIQIEIRDWEKSDLDWWESYGISIDTLKKYKIYACKTVWLNDNLFYVWNYGQKAYGYFGGIKDGIEYWRIYFPGKKRYKFVSNWRSSFIQGANVLPQKSDYLLVTKSLKDVAVLHEYGVPAIAPCSENLFITDLQYNKLKNKYKNIYLLYDNDYAGVCAANKIHKKYPDVKILIIPRKYGKDISDVRRYCGHKKVLELIDEAKKYLEIQ